MAFFIDASLVGIFKNDAYPVGNSGTLTPSFLSQILTVTPSDDSADIAPKVNALSLISTHAFSGVNYIPSFGPPAPEPLYFQSASLAGVLPGDVIDGLISTQNANFVAPLPPFLYDEGAVIICPVQNSPGSGDTAFAVAYLFFASGTPVPPGPSTFPLAGFSYPSENNPAVPRQSVPPFNTRMSYQNFCRSVPGITMMKPKGA